MKKQISRIIRDYKRLSNAALLSRATNVYNSMNANALFANPPVAMADLLLQNNNLEQAMVNAQHRDRLKSAQKNAIIATLIAMLDKLADWVTALAGDDDNTESVLLASGFAVSSNAGADTFGPITDFSVTVTAVSGQVLVKFRKIFLASSYTYWFGIDNGDTTVWQHINNTKAKLVISSLQAGKIYAFKVEATGGNEKSCVSDIIKRMVA